MQLLAKSVFNWNFDLQLPRHGEIALEEFVFCFVLLNITYAIVTYLRDKRIPRLGGWFLCALFCLYAFWDTDYFSFAVNFKSGLEDFRDPLYPFLSQISFGSYVLFRFWIWVVGLWLFYLTCKRFSLPENLSCFVFAFYFLTTYCYARVSFGMVLYFYGLSFLLIKDKARLWRIIIALCLFVLAFFAHRSIALLIALTPVAYFEITKRKLIIILIIAAIVIVTFNFVMIDMIQLYLGTDSSVSEGLNQYLKFTNEQQMNWKYWFMTTMHYCSFYFAMIYFSYKLFFRNWRQIMPKYVMSFYNIALLSMCVALLFLNSNAFGLWIIGYRILYMTGIPLSIIIIYTYQKKLYSKKVLWLLMAASIIYSEGFILGKILSLS